MIFFSHWRLSLRSDIMTDLKRKFRNRDESENRKLDNLLHRGVLEHNARYDTPLIISSVYAPSPRKAYYEKGDKATPGSHNKRRRSGLMDRLAAAAAVDHQVRGDLFTEFDMSARECTHCHFTVLLVVYSQFGRYQ